MDLKLFAGFVLCSVQVQTVKGAFQVYQGCWYDNRWLSERALNFEVEEEYYDEWDGLTQDKCFRECRKRDYTFAGVAWEVLCYCGNALGEEKQDEDTKCRVHKCRGNTNQYCGGDKGYYYVWMVSYDKLPINLAYKRTTYQTELDIYDHFFRYSSKDNVVDGHLSYYAKRGTRVAEVMQHLGAYKAYDVGKGFLIHANADKVLWWAVKMFSDNHNAKVHGVLISTMTTRPAPGFTCLRLKDDYKDKLEYHLQEVDMEGKNHLDGCLIKCRDLGHLWGFLKGSSCSCMKAFRMKSGVKREDVLDTPVYRRVCNVDCEYVPDGYEGINKASLTKCGGKHHYTMFPVNFMTQKVLVAVAFDKPTNPNGRQFCNYFDGIMPMVTTFVRDSRTNQVAEIYMQCLRHKGSWGHTVVVETKEGILSLAEVEVFMKDPGCIKPVQQYDKFHPLPRRQSYACSDNCKRPPAYNLGEITQCHSHDGSAEECAVPYCLWPRVKMTTFGEWSAWSSCDPKTRVKTQTRTCNQGTFRPSSDIPCQLNEFLLNRSISCADERPSKDWIPNIDCRTTQKGEKYVGYVSMTIQGTMCEPWNRPNVAQGSMHPVKNGKFDPYTQFPDGLNYTKYCRNPDGSRQPWCFVYWKESLPEGKSRWAYCDIPMCPTHLLDPQGLPAVRRTSTRRKTSTTSGPVSTKGSRKTVFKRTQKGTPKGTQRGTTKGTQTGTAKGTQTGTAKGTQIDPATGGTPKVDQKGSSAGTDKGDSSSGEGTKDIGDGTSSNPGDQGVGGGNYTTDGGDYTTDGGEDIEGSEEDVEPVKTTLAIKDIDWDDDMLNPMSIVYQETAERIEENIAKIMESANVESFEITVNKLSPGSVVADADIRSWPRQDQTPQDASNAVADLLTRAISTEQVGSLQVSKDESVVQKPKSAMKSNVTVFIVIGACGGFVLIVIFIFALSRKQTNDDDSDSGVTSEQSESQ